MLSVRQYSFALFMVAATVTNNFSNALPSGDYSAAMLARVNQERAKQGLSSLCINTKLQSAAQRHSADMAKNNFMGHDGSDSSSVSQRITEAGYEWDSVAENVAAGQEEIDSVMKGWMESPGHRENIMSPDYTMFGTAYSYNKDSTFGIYWTQDFGSGAREACDGNSNTPTPTPTTSAPTTSAPVPETPAVVVPIPTIPAMNSAPFVGSVSAPTPGASRGTTGLNEDRGEGTPPALSSRNISPLMASTTPVPVVPPVITTPPSQKDCESNF